MFDNLPKKIKIVEVGARDGLQNEKVMVSTEDKYKFIELLSLTGLKNIEVTSFVSPKAIPQMSDSRELFSKVNSSIKNINFPCLVPNLKGYESAIESGVKEIALFSATSDEFTKKNINASVEESFKRMEDIALRAKSDSIKMRGYISTAFGCPYQGEMPKEKLLEVIHRFLNLGVYEISIGDTIGVATPLQVDEYIDFVKQATDLSKVAMHFHDTRGMALSNILVSLKHGISIYDSSAGGLGGCPYAKGATGNVATEDLLYLFDSLGIEAGVDLEKLVKASTFILNIIKKQTPSKFLTAYLKA